MTGDRRLEYREAQLLLPLLLPLLLSLTTLPRSGRACGVPPTTPTMSQIARCATHCGRCTMVDQWRQRPP